MNSNKHILITGGTGFIGSALTEKLLTQQHKITILSRTPDKVTQKWQQRVNAIKNLSELDSDSHIDWLINLAGAPIIDRPWTQKRKALLRQSRIDLTRNLFQQLQQNNLNPEVIISGSAIGFYGNTGEQTTNEQDAKGLGFAADLCDDWEQTAIDNTPANSRLCLLRTGVVLGNGGGMLARTILPFKLGLGGRLGDGQQWMSWIALEDICQLILFLATTPTCEGVYNATAPEPVTNSEFTTTLAKLLNRPSLFTMPSFVLNTLLGEAASLLLDSQKILPKRATDAGFEFQYPTLTSCLEHSLSL